jgi:hypothetical protein
LADPLAHVAELVNLSRNRQAQILRKAAFTTPIVNNFSDIPFVHGGSSANHDSENHCPQYDQSRSSKHLVEITSKVVLIQLFMLEKVYGL